MKNSKISKFVVSVVLATTMFSPAFAGVGDFFNRVGKSIDIAVGDASALEKLEYDMGSIVRSLSSACADFEHAKARAYIAVGDAENAAKSRVLAENLNSEKSLQVLDKYLKTQNSSNARDIVNSGKLNSEESRKEVIKSMKHMADALRVERLQSTKVATSSATAQAMLKALSGDEKKKAEEKIGFLVEFGKSYPKYVETTKSIMNSYIETARKKGIDTLPMTKKLAEILSEQS